jgi:hypothetical protein
LSATSAGPTDSARMPPRGTGTTASAAPPSRSDRDAAAPVRLQDGRIPSKSLASSRDDQRERLRKAYRSESPQTWPRPRVFPRGLSCQHVAAVVKPKNEWCAKLTFSTTCPAGRVQNSVSPERALVIQGSDVAQEGKRDLCRLRARVTAPELKTWAGVDRTSERRADLLRHFEMAWFTPTVEDRCPALRLSARSPFWKARSHKTTNVRFVVENSQPSES